MSRIEPHSATPAARTADAELPHVALRNAQKLAQRPFGGRRCDCNWVGSYEKAGCPHTLRGPCYEDAAVERWEDSPTVGKGVVYLCSLCNEAWSAASAAEAEMARMADEVLP